MPAYIRAEGLSKKYVIRHLSSRPNDTLRDAITHGLGRVGRAIWRRNKPGNGEHDTTHEDFWALRDVNFELAHGERLGIVGRNGAGKSTLLKILSRITEPSSGAVTIHGRVASLLEVGTGFHPELTGRENVYLNGAILGMSRNDIRARFDEIVSFAEIEKFIDTPVKRYSSGMTVRLAFAVAAHLEPDILIADEVLAVGDAAFQRKSLGKMDDVASQGRTVLFVSHNLGIVRNLCRSVLLLEGGQIKFQGPTEEGLALYERCLVTSPGTLGSVRFQGPLADRIAFEELTFRQENRTVTIVDPLRDFDIEIKGKAPRFFPSLELNIGIFRDGFHLGSCHDAPLGTPMREGSFRSRFRIPKSLMKPGRYTIGIGVVAASGDWAWGTDAAILELSENWGDDSAVRDRGAIGFQYSSERIQ